MTWNQPGQKLVHVVFTDFEMMQSRESQNIYKIKYSPIQDPNNAPGFWHKMIC